MLSGLLFHFAVILLPILLYQALFFNKPFEQLRLRTWFLGVYGGVSGILCELTPVTVVGVPADFKSIPILLGILYGGPKAGLLSLASVLLFRFYMGQSGAGLAMLSIVLYVIPAFLMSRRFFQIRLARRVLLSFGLSWLSVVIQISFVALYYTLYGHISYFYQYILNNHFAIALFAIQGAATLLCTFIVENIVENGRIRSELLRSENALRQAHRIARIGNWEWNLETKTSTYSDGIYEVFGLTETRGSATDEVFVKSVHADDFQAVKAFIDGMIDGTYSPNDTHEFRIIHPDGQIRYVQMRAEIVHGEDGSAQTFRATVQDITEAQVAKQSLQDSEQRYKSLLEFNATGVCAVDLEGRYTDVNAAFERMTGYRREELVGQSRLLLWFPEDRHIAQKIWESFGPDQPYDEVEAQLRHKSGRPIIVNYFKTPIIVNREVVGYYGIMKDVTEIRKTEEMVRKSDRLAAIGQLAAGVAHEIRNPLTSLKGFTELFREYVPAEKSQFVDLMMRELSRIQLITSELLVFAKPQVDEFGVYSIRTIVEHAILLMEPQALMQNVQISASFEEGDFRAFCSETQIKQVLVNLFKNALDAMPKGGSIDVQLRRTDDQFVLEVQDNGNGMPGDVLARLGEPFYTTKDKGTGLGLMVTYKIVDRHKGTISYDSEVGQGTTVTLSLPVYRRALGQDHTTRVKEEVSSYS